jgi:hypothetical protein
MLAGLAGMLVVLAGCTDSHPRNVQAVSDQESRDEREGGIQVVMPPPVALIRTEPGKYDRDPLMVSAGTGGVRVIWITGSIAEKPDRTPLWGSIATVEFTPDGALDDLTPAVLNLGSSRSLVAATIDESATNCVFTFGGANRYGWALIPLGSDAPMAAGALEWDRSRGMYIVLKRREDLIVLSSQQSDLLQGGRAVIAEVCPAYRGGDIRSPRWVGHVVTENALLSDACLSGSFVVCAAQTDRASGMLRVIRIGISEPHTMQTQVCELPANDPGMGLLAYGERDMVDFTQRARIAASNDSIYLCTLERGDREGYCCLYVRRFSGDDLRPVAERVLARSSDRRMGMQCLAAGSNRVVVAWLESGDSGQLALSFVVLSRDLVVTHRGSHRYNNDVKLSRYEDALCTVINQGNVVLLLSARLNGIAGLHCYKIKIE